MNTITKKNKIRLGISSVASCLRSSKLKRTMATTKVEMNNNNTSFDIISSVSSDDLDEMFDKNLKLLQEIEKRISLSSNASNQPAKRFNSSLNVYIKPKESLRNSNGVYYSHCNVFPNRDAQSLFENRKSCHLSKSSLYSSYETLYDGLKCTSNDSNKKQDNGSKDQSEMDISNHSFNELPKAKENRSLNSENPLKSITSTNTSSSVSSLESQTESMDIFPFHNGNSFSEHLNDYQSSDIIPKLRPLSKINESRPNSCFVDTKFGQYLSNRNPQRPNIIILKRNEWNEKSNLVISKPLGNYPSRLCNSFVSIDNDKVCNSSILIQRSSADVHRENPVPSADCKIVSAPNQSCSASNILNHHIMANGCNEQIGTTKFPNILNFPNPLKYVKEKKMMKQANNNLKLTQKIPDKDSLRNKNKKKSCSHIKNSHMANVRNLQFSSSDEIKSIPHSKYYQIKREDNRI